MNCFGNGRVKTGRFLCTGHFYLCSASVALLMPMRDKLVRNNFIELRKIENFNQSNIVAAYLYKLIFASRSAILNGFSRTPSA